MSQRCTNHTYNLMQVCTHTDFSTRSHSPEQVSTGTRVMFSHSIHTRNLRG